jgi:hypothetical protein
MGGEERKTNYSNFPMRGRGGEGGGGVRSHVGRSGREMTTCSSVL